MGIILRYDFGWIGMIMIHVGQLLKYYNLYYKFKCFWIQSFRGDIYGVSDRLDGGWHHVTANSETNCMMHLE